MANVIKMPLLSDTMVEGVLAEVFFKVGDNIESGAVLAEVETDKATLEVEAYDEHEGTLLYMAESGATIPVGDIMAITGEKGEDISAILAGGGAASTPEETPKEEVQSAEASNNTTETTTIPDNANIIIMPLLSDTMTEGVLADTFFKKGDKIESGAVLAEVETDKATMEVEAYDEHEGTLLYMAAPGEAVPVGGILAITGEEGIDVDAILKAGAPSLDAGTTPSHTNAHTAAHTDAMPATTQSAAEPVITSTANGRIKASPLAKKMAEDNNLDLGLIKGSGENGRIVKRDVQEAINTGGAKKGAVSATAVAGAAAATAVAAANQSKPAAPQHNFISVAATGEEQTEEIRVTQIRKTIAKRLAESKFQAPHFYLTIEANMDNIMAARKEMNQLSPVKISFNDLVMKAAALALRQHPDVNSSWQGDKIIVNKHVHIGMAVAIDSGLVVPVIRFADNMPLSQMAATTKALAGKARSGDLTLDEMKGGTFSVSNLGAAGIEEFTAIINPPNAAIMAVGGINKRMREINGEMKATNVMKVTLSCDHRVVDGAVGSAYLQTFKQYIENPTLMLV